MPEGHARYDARRRPAGAWVNPGHARPSRVRRTAGLITAAGATDLLVAVETAPGPNGNGPSWTSLPAGPWLLNIAGALITGAGTYLLVLSAATGGRPNARQGAFWSLHQSRFAPVDPGVAD